MPLDIKNNFIRNSLAVLVVLLFLGSFQIIFPKTFSFFSNKLLIFTKPFYEITKVVLNKNKSNEELIEENELLRETIRNLTMDYARLEILEKENQEIKTLYNFYDQNNYETVTAEIIGLQKIDNNQLIILDRGTKAGITKGSPVIVDNGILLGLVSQTENNISYVITPNQNLVAISAKVIGKGEGIHGVVEGIAGVSTYLNLIPKEIEIEINDLVVTSGVDPMIPGGLVVGFIEKINDCRRNR